MSTKTTTTQTLLTARSRCLCSKAFVPEVLEPRNEFQRLWQSFPLSGSFNDVGLTLLTILSLNNAAALDITVFEVFGS